MTTTYIWDRDNNIIEHVRDSKFERCNINIPDNLAFIVSPQDIIFDEPDFFERKGCYKMNCAKYYFMYFEEPGNAPLLYGGRSGFLQRLNATHLYWGKNETVIHFKNNYNHDRKIIIEGSKYPGIRLEEPTKIRWTDGKKKILLEKLF